MRALAQLFNYRFNHLGVIVTERNIEGPRDGIEELSAVLSDKAQSSTG
jgi:hypothetical protein